MSVIKKWLSALIVILVIAGMVFWTGCGELGLPADSETAAAVNETEAEAQETAAKSNVKGETYETEKFSILVPEGWEIKDLSNEATSEHGSNSNVEITRDEYFLAVNAAGSTTVDGVETPATEAFLKSNAEDLANAFNGTAVSEVTMLNTKFFMTSYTIEGKDTTFYAGLRNGLGIAIMMGGKDHQNNVEIKAMLESIKFK